MIASAPCETPSLVLSEFVRSPTMSCQFMISRCGKPIGQNLTQLSFLPSLADKINFILAISEQDHP